MTSSRCDLTFYMSVLFINLVIIAIASGDNSVSLLSDKPHQSVTSSTLNWLPASYYEETKTIVVGGFRETNDSNDPSTVEKARQMFVCRVSHKGAWVAGTLLEGTHLCTVTLVGSVASSENYELLENVENAARLNWVAWNKYSLIIPGAVKTDTMIVARYITNEKNEDNTSSNNAQYIGTLDATDDFGLITYVKDDGKEGSASEGQILVETEPIYYELKLIKLNLSRKRIVKNEPQIIGQATISNSRNEPAKLAKAFGYSYNYSSYWGQGHAMIKALNTSITLGNGTRLCNIAWGMYDETPERSDAHTVEIYLQPGTAVNVTLRANYTDYEAGYTGQLVSHYADGETKTRGINGKRREVTMMDLKPEFGPIYFLSNLSIVPTTLAPPTTHTTTGATSGSTLKSTTLDSSSSSSATSAIVTGFDITKNDNTDENMIVPPREIDRSNKDSDNSGAQLLKNGEDLNHSSSNAFQLSITILLTSLLVNLYQIT